MVTAAAAVALGFLAAITRMLTGLGNFGSRAAAEAFGVLIRMLPLRMLGVAAPPVLSLPGRRWRIVGVAAPAVLSLSGRRWRIVGVAAWETLILV